MWQCPVCKTTSTNLLCRECGFDGSADYEHYPTFSAVSGKAISVHQKLYAASKRPFIKCGNCAGTLFRVDPERFEMQCDQCGTVQPLPVKSAPVEKPIAPKTDIPAFLIASAPLRFDGLYQSPSKDSSYYLRFYADGSVVGSSSTGDALAVSRWLNLSHKYSGTGKYTVHQNNISFSLRSSYGVVDYQGIITENGLELHIHSHINGFRGLYKYTFVKI